MQSFENPFADNRSFADALGLGDALYLLNVPPGKVDAQRCALGPRKNSLAHFLQGRLELRQVVSVPELSQFLNRVGVGQFLLPQDFFYLLYRLFSFRVIGRAVTGSPLPPGNWITTHQLAACGTRALVRQAHRLH